MFDIVTYETNDESLSVPGNGIGRECFLHQGSRRESVTYGGAYETTSSVIASGCGGRVGVVALPSAAQAQSGGGCTSARVSACSSYSNFYGRQSGDFYLNSWGSECAAKVYLRTNGNRVYHYHVGLDHLGRYPEVHKYITSQGNGRTEVELFNCSGGYMYTTYSPYIYFP